MEVTEIVLLVAGGIIFILSFLLPDPKDKRQGESAVPMAREEVRTLVEQEMDTVKGHLDDVVNEAVTYAMEKTERSLERLSNEKIMAVNEYSDTVLSEIHRNHEEVMFLYDMLNSKHANLKNTVSEVTRTVKEAEVTVNTFQKLAPESVVPAPVVPYMPESDSETPAVKKPVASPSTTHSAPKAAFVRAAEEQMAMGSNSNDRILRLYQRGMDKIAIAKELGLGVGEVKLVIDLFDSENKGK